MHNAKRALCLLVSLSILFTLASILTLSTTAIIGSNEPMVAIGDKFMIVQTTSGELWGWGDNANKVLGETEDENVTSPIKIQLPSGITSVSASAGSAHVLMLGSDGDVYAWGRNDHGQLGISNNGETLITPTLVEGLKGKNIVAVSAGRLFSLALSESGKVYAFGANNNLQLGYKTEIEYSATPTLIESLSGIFVTQIYAGYESAIAVDKSGSSYLWGSTENYLLGVDKSSSGKLPFPLSDLQITASVRSADLSAGFSAFLQSDGRVGFMGFNNQGQYGNGTIAQSASKQFKVTDTSAHNIVAIAVSDAQSVLLTANGKVLTAGARIPNDEQSASTGFVPLFAQDAQAPTGVAIAAGYQNGALIAQDGSVWTWGDNSRGQLGCGTVGDAQKEPVKVFTLEDSDFDAGQAPNTVGMQIKVTTSIPAPTYSIVIPATVDVGDLRQTDETDPNRNSYTKFTLEATNVSNLFGEKEIQVSVHASDPNGIFYLEDSNGSVLPFDLLTAPDAQTVIGSGDVLARFSANGKIDAYIRIDQSNITQSGIYNGILVFSYTVADIDR